MFAISLRHAEHIRRYSISPAGLAGWEVHLEEDRTVQRHEHYTDWHRVERILARFEREVLELTAQGWTRLLTQPEVRT